MISRASRQVAGILFLVFPTVIFGGASLLQFLISRAPGYLENPVRQDLFRAGHAHAGVILILSLVALRYVDEAELGHRAKSLVRSAIPLTAILLPVAFFLSIASPGSTEPSGLVYLAFLAALVLATALVVLGIGLIRKSRPSRRGPCTDVGSDEEKE